MDSLWWERKRMVCPVASKGGSEEREWALSHCWSVLLLGSEEREYALLCWLACPAASQGGSKERECALLCCWACPAAGQWGSETRGREMVSAVFYIAPGRWPGKNGINHSHWTKYMNPNSNDQSNSRTK